MRCEYRPTAHPTPEGGWGSLGCLGTKLGDDLRTIYDLVCILGHFPLVDGVAMSMWQLCAGEVELMRVRMSHPGFAAFVGTDGI